MAKLEEITELLCSEIHGFEQGILRLEKLHREMKEFQMNADTPDIERLFHEHRRETKRDMDRQKESMDRILDRLGNTVFLPSWTVKLGWGLLVCTMLVLGYAVMEVSRAAKREEAAYLKGEKGAKEYFGEFLEKHPETEELYREWFEENNKD